MSGYDETLLKGSVPPLPTFRPELAGRILRSGSLTEQIRADYVSYTVITNRERQWWPRSDARPFL